MGDRSASKSGESEADLQAHLAEMEAQAMADDLVAGIPEDRTSLALDLQRLQDELQSLQARLAVIKEQGATVVRTNLEWADESAHAQLGNYPWLKLAGAMTATFLAGRMLRNAPVAAILAAVVPFVLSRSEK